MRYEVKLIGVRSKFIVLNICAGIKEYFIQRSYEDFLSFHNQFIAQAKDLSIAVSKHIFDYRGMRFEIPEIPAKTSPMKFFAVYITHILNIPRPLYEVFIYFKDDLGVCDICFMVFDVGSR
jgi:hypothetical protein